MSRTSFIVVTTILSLALVGLLAYGVLGSGTDDSLDSAVAEGQRPAAPQRDLRRPLLDGGGERALADFGGKPVLLNFWASWCEPCAEEMPLLQDAQRRLAARGGTILGATFQDTPARSKAFEAKFDVGWPSVRDVGTELADGFGNTGLPETFLLDADGRVLDLWRGQLTKPVLDRMLAKVGA